MRCWGNGGRKTTTAASQRPSETREQIGKLMSGKAPSDIYRYADADAGHVLQFQPRLAKQTACVCVWWT